MTRKAQRQPDSPAQPRPDQARPGQPASQSATPRLCLAARRKKIGKMEIEIYKKNKPDISEIELEILLLR